jgi:hypothetical protein
VLEQHGYIRPGPALAHAGPGKPPGPRFAVHPNIGGIGGTRTRLTPGAEGAEGLVLYRDNSIYSSTNAPPHCRLPRSGSTPNTPNIPPEHYVFLCDLPFLRRSGPAAAGRRKLGRLVLRHAVCRHVRWSRAGR